MSRREWHRSALEKQGFAGWLTWAEWPPPSSDLPRLAGGVYVLYRTSSASPTFLPVSTGARHKNRDPSVSLAQLQANWVEGANVVYIGKAIHGQLRERLRQYRRMGTARTGNHWGGRLIWHLADSDDLLVAYKTLPAMELPRLVEQRMIEDFISAHGKRPFANDPHLLGG